MKFIIDREVFMDSMNIVSRILPARTPLPILMCIKLDLSKEKLVITSSNTDIAVMISLDKKDVQIEQIGKCVVPGRYFIEFIRKINCKKITVTLLEDKVLMLQSDRGEYSFKVEDYNTYPNIELINKDKPLLINSNAIKSIFRQNGFAVSSSDKKPVLTGVNFKKTENKIVVTATDSFRLGQSIININKESPDFEINLPNKSLDDLSKSLDNSDDEVEVHIEKNKALFKFKNILFQTRLLDGEYPNTSKLIPEDFNLEISFNTDELIGAVERVSLLSPKDGEKNELTYSIIKLDVKNDKSVTISSNNSLIGEANELVVPTNNDFKGTISISFSSRYILEALRSFTSQEVVISLVNNYRTFIIRSKEYNNNDKKDDNLLTHLILPVRAD